MPVCGPGIQQALNQCFWNKSTHRLFLSLGCAFLLQVPFKEEVGCTQLRVPRAEHVTWSWKVLRGSAMTYSPQASPRAGWGSCPRFWGPDLGRNSGLPLSEPGHREAPVSVPCLSLARPWSSLLPQGLCSCYPPAWPSPSSSSRAGCFVTSSERSLSSCSP